MKKIMLLILTMILPFIPCEGGKKDLPIPVKKEGYLSDAGKHGLEPASENIKKALDENIPILSQGMKGLGREFGEVMMQKLPHNILLSGAIVMGTVVVSKVTDAGIKHIEKSISGELAAERIENQRKQLESYRNMINAHTNMNDIYKRDLIALKEAEVAAEDLMACRKRYVSDWMPFTRKKLYCDSDGDPIECQGEFLRFIGSTQDPEKTKEMILPFLYQKS